MRTRNRHRRFLRAALVVAVSAAFGVAHAEEDEVVTESTVSAGVGVVSGNGKDRALFGQYNGLRPDRAYGLLDFEYYRRDDEKGMVSKFHGTDLLRENRELHLLWKRQGRWKFSADYSELVRRDLRTLNTAMLGWGTTAPQVVHLATGPGTDADRDPKTKRQGIAFGYSTRLSRQVEFQASLKSENKDGTRLSGIGFGCPSPIAPGCRPGTAISPGWAVLPIAEPINSNHSQMEARLSYAGQKLRISTGYYGSFYNNSNGSLTPFVPASLNNPLGVLQPLNAGLQPLLSQPIALAPDNQAHHIDVTGMYVFTPRTRATFKLGTARATQNQGFAGSGFLGPVGVTDLDGRVDTSLAQLGLSSRPTAKLSLLAEYRRDVRNDKTPLALYNVIGAAGTTTYLTYTNRQRDYTKSRGKLQASYQFSSDWRGTLGVDYEAIDRGTITPSTAFFGISALRQKTEELGWRAELRKRMTETFSGGISFVTSERDGSGWLRPVGWGTGVVPYGNPPTWLTASSTFMPTLADRDRDKVRLYAVWQPSESLTLQFSADYGRDDFASPSTQGLQRTDMHLYNVDWDYALSTRWRLNGYLSVGSQTIDQARPAGYVMAYDNDNTAIGVGAVGRVDAKLHVGGTLSWFNDRNAYSQTLEQSAGYASTVLLAASGGLPDIVFRTTELRLFGRYLLSKSSSVQIDLVHYRARFNDWSYRYDGTPFLFSDNSTVTQLQRQNVTFVGLTYTHRWQ
jgi:MtrB/PioB family decaheme-associated outer membrane protein